MTHPVILEVTQRLVERSQATRAAFVSRTEEQAKAGKGRVGLSCGNLAHAVAASCSAEKKNILDFTHSNVALISA
ncbi:TPA: phosphogluconate dehydratase, partial [Vibrio vulnificus]|nr:phosphogluconate dehydratase [Vibrio vulnificus]